MSPPTLNPQNAADLIALPTQANPTSKCQFLLTPITKCIRYTAAHPIITVISLTASAAPSLYSLTLISGLQPRDLGTSWWGEMNAGEKFFSILSSGVSVFIFILINLKYFPRAQANAHHNLSHALDSPYQLLKNLLSILLALGVGIIYGAQSYDAFLWTFIALSIISGVSNFASYLARRYNGLIELVTMIELALDADMKFQRQCIMHLSLLQAHQKELLLKEFIGKPLDEANALACMIAIFNKAQMTDSLQMFSQSSKTAHARHLLMLACQLSLGIFCAYSAVSVGIESSFGGYSILSQGKIDGLSTVQKIIPALIPAIVNAIFYFVSGFDTLYSISQMQRNVKEHPWNTGKLILMLSALGLAASGYYTVAKGVVEDENIEGITPNSGIGISLPAIYATGAFLTGVNNTDIVFAGKNEIKDLDDVIMYAKRHKFSQTNLSALRAHAFFKETSGSLQPPEQSVIINIAPDKLATQLVMP